MKRIALLIFISYFMYSHNLYCQYFTTDKSRYEAVNVSMSFKKNKNKEVIRVIKDTTMKQVADNYQGQTENERGAEVAEKFQNLSV